ncbi:MAG: ABC transporter permease, partial [Muribaculaceae bacterium]|nr:ABC transporter permease [Muribaculaceae bacterium]
DYLSLYNFGFAMPQGLPKLSEDIIGSIPIDVTLTGQNGLSATFEAAIVGFSSRLNTIAVPQSFIDWANNRFAPGSTTENAWSSRLIVKTDPLLTSQMQEYFTTRNIEIAGDREADSQIAGLMRTVAVAVTANGAIICALAFFILTLSIYLLLQKNENMLRNVIRLGYQPSKVSRIYERIVTRINCGIGAIAMTAAITARTLWLPSLNSAGLGGGNIWTAVGATAAFIALSSIQNTILIRRRISSLSA